MTKSKTLLGSLLAGLLAFAGHAHASPIMGSPTGLVAPENVVTFDDIVDLSDPAAVAAAQGTIITNQLLATHGVAFSNLFWDGNTLGQNAAIGIEGASLVTADPNALSAIGFVAPVMEAAFAVVDQDNLFTVVALLGGLSGTIVESFDVTIPSISGGPIGFIGFEGIVFDTIAISKSGFLVIDTVQFSLVPAPGTLVLMSLPLLVLRIARRKKSAS